MVVVWSREGYRPGLGIYIIGQSSQSASNTFAIGGRPLVMTSRRDNHHTPYTSQLTVVIAKTMLLAVFIVVDAALSLLDAEWTATEQIIARSVWVR